MIASNLEGYMRVGLDHICFFRNDLYHQGMSGISSNFLIQVGHLQGKAMKTSMSQQKSSGILKKSKSLCTCTAYCAENWLQVPGPWSPCMVGLFQVLSSWVYSLQCKDLVPKPVCNAQKPPQSNIYKLWANNPPLRWVAKTLLGPDFDDQANHVAEACCALLSCVRRCIYLVKWTIFMLKNKCFWIVQRFSNLMKLVIRIFAHVLCRCSTFFSGLLVCWLAGLPACWWDLPLCCEIMVGGVPCGCGEMCPLLWPVRS
jgi:hypothetical protein